MELLQRYQSEPARCVGGADFEVNGTPQLKLRAEVLPTDMNLPMEELVATGSIITASPVVNAIPSVVAARPGIVTYADFPPVTSILRPKAIQAAPVPLRAAEAQAAPPPVTTHKSQSLAGAWKVTIKGPTGPKDTMLTLECQDGTWTGSMSGDGNTSPISGATLEGNALSWINHTPKPMKLKCEFKAVVDGTRMSGKMKAGFMGSYAFSAEKL